MMMVTVLAGWFLLSALLALVLGRALRQGLRDAQSPPAAPAPAAQVPAVPAVPAPREPVRAAQYGDALTG